MLEELARADVSAAILAQLIFNGPPRAIEHLGSDTLRDRWLPIAATGEGLFCIGISETEAGSSVGNMRARLTADGDGFRLNAYKNYVTGGHKARAASRLVPLPAARAKAWRGRRRSRSTRRQRHGTHIKMGLRATSEAELAFDDVRVEPEDVLVWGDPSHNESFKTLIGHINHERCGNAAMCIGAAQGVPSTPCSTWANARWATRPWPTSRACSGSPTWRRSSKARLLLQRRCTWPAHGTPPALETAMAKTAANLAAKFVCDEAIQLLGGYGFSREYPVEKVYCDIRGSASAPARWRSSATSSGAACCGTTPASDGWKQRRS